MRIVLVDPSRAVRRILSGLIAEGGHEVLTFSDGLEALASISQDDRVRCLITSTQPLSISGLELCVAARKLSGTRRALHVILMSSTDDYYLAVTALDNGADDFIHKPPNPDELRARLRLADRVTLMKQQLIHYATTDPLTGLLNRRAFFEAAAEMCKAAESGTHFSTIMFDIDHFKRVNDTYGHEVGDRVLAAVGAQAKLSDVIAGRLGGEEFCVLQTGGIIDALRHAGEMQGLIRALRFGRSAEVLAITCSFGITEWEQGDVIDQMLRRADMAMYEAKKAGRDRILASNSMAVIKGYDERRGVARVKSR